MTDPFSIAAGVAGIVSLSGHVFHGINTFRKQAAGAHPAVTELSNQTRNLSGILQNLALLVSSLEDESRPGGGTVSLRAQNLNACRQTLRRIEQRLKVAEDDFAAGSRRKAVLRSLKWPFSVEETKELLNEMAGHQRTLELALSADSMVKLLQCLAKQEAVENSVDKLRDTIERRLAIDTRVTLNTKRKKIVDFFLRINPQVNFQACLNLRQPMTGLWLTESNPVFSRWKNGHNSGIWLNGIPGAGKTVLCGSVIEEVLQDSSPQVAVAFFFCEYKNEKSQETVNILSVLAAQLAWQNDDAFELLRKYYAELHPEKRLRKEPITNDLLDVIQQMTDLYEKVFLVIDGLDECGSNIRHVLQSLKLLLRASPAASMALFSRDEPEVREELAEEFDHIEIAAHTEDLELYVRAEMAKRSQLCNLAVKNAKLEEEMRQSLVNGAKGMFRWVACQIDHLCELPTNRARRKALEQLPPTLFETYDRILERLLPMPIEVRKIVQKTLYWIALGKNMHMGCLREAVSVPDDVDEMDADDVVGESEVIRGCSSLVRTFLGGKGLEFAHFTVLEYLESIDASSPLAFFRVSKKRATLSCLSTSFRFLTFADFERRPMAIPSEVDVMVERDEKHPFHRRASLMVLDSVRDAVAQEALAELLEDVSFFNYAEKLFSPKKPGIFLSWILGGIYNLVRKEEKGLVDLVTCILRPGFTPLHLAVCLSQPAICRYLLGKGVDANSPSDLGAPIHFSLVGSGFLHLCSLPPSVDALSALGGISLAPWSKAADATMSLLLDHGADPTQSWRSVSALAFAVDLSLKTWNPKRLLSLLRPTTTIPDDALRAFERVGRHAESDYCEELLNGLLNKLSQSGPSSNLARLLPSVRRITRRADMDFPSLPPAMQYVADMSDKDILDAMKVAAEFDFGEDIKTLIAYAVSSRRDWALRAGNTPMLHIAAKNDSKEAVAALLDAGFDVDTTDDKGRTAFHICCVRSHPETAEVLLERGARIDGGSAAGGGSSWHVAAHHDASEVLSLLFRFDGESAQSLAVVSDEGRTPLACAIVSGAANASQLILDRCKQPYHQEIFRSNLPLLHAAAESGNQSLFCQLVGSGVVLPEISDDGSTPLHHLRPFCSVDFLRHLLTRYDPFQPRNDGKIPLELILLRLDDQQGLWGPQAVEVDAEVVRSLLPADHVLPRAGAAGVHLWEFFCDTVVSRFTSSCSKHHVTPQVSPAASSVSMSSRSSDGDDPDAAQNKWERIRASMCKRGIICSVTNTLISCGVLTSFETANELPAFDPLFSALLVRVPDSEEDGGSIFCAWIAPVVNAALESTRFPKKGPRGAAHGELLMRAIRVGMHPLVAALLGYDSDVHSGIGLESPAEAACRMGDLPTFREVLKHIDKDRINEARLQRAPLLFQAVMGPDIDKFGKIKALLRHGADPGLTFPLDSGEPASLISLAAEKNHFGVVELLHEMGASLYGEHVGFTVATAAVSRGNFPILKTLQEGDVPQGYWEKTLQMQFTDASQATRVMGAGCTLLHAAATSRNSCMVEYLLDQGLGLDVNAAAEDGATPLHVAAVTATIEVVTTLIERGADVNRRDKAGLLPLDRSLELHDLDVARALIKAGSMRTSLPRLMGLQVAALGDAKGPASLGRCASQLAFDLEYAIEAGDLARCKAIVDEGCSIDAVLPSCQGCPPLIKAVRTNRPDIVSWLILRGANADNISCQTVFEPFWALAPLATFHLDSMECFEQVLNYVLECGIDPFGWPYNPLHVAAQYEKMPALQTIICHIRSHEKAYRRVMGVELPRCCAATPEPLLAHLVNKKQGRLYSCETHSSCQVLRPLDGEPRGNPLHIASLRGHLETVKTLIAARADVNAADEDGRSPLTIAARHGSVPIAGILIESGGRLNHRDDWGYTPLMHAAEKGLLHMAELLCKKGADIFAADDDGTTALELAAGEANGPAVLGYLLSQGAPLGRTIYGVSTTETALRKPAMRSFVFNSGMMRENAETLEHLLSYSISLNESSFIKKFYRALPGPVARRLTNMKPNLWFTPLCLAAIKDDTACGRILLDHGADIDLEGSPEGSPLMAACSHGRLEMVRLLVRSGARLEYTSEEGVHRSAFASMRSHPHVIKWFLLGRFLEQKRLPSRPSPGVGEVKPWSGVQPFRLKLPRDLWQRQSESTVEVLRRRHAFLARIKGNIVR